MPTSAIILTTLKNFNFIIYLSLLLLLSFHCHLITQKHIFHKKLVIAEVGWTPFIMFIFCLIFRIMVVEKAFDVAMSTTKLFLCTAYNHHGVLFYV